MEKLYACVINEITGYKCTYCEKEAKYEVKMA